MVLYCIEGTTRNQIGGISAIIKLLGRLRVHACSTFLRRAAAGHMDATLSSLNTSQKNQLRDADMSEIIPGLYLVGFENDDAVLLFSQFLGEQTFCYTA